MLNFEQMLTPIWDTETVWGESLTMLREADGTAEAPLLYPPKKVLEVTNAAFTQTYEEGRDWFVQGDRLCLTPDSRIFAFTREELYPAEATEGHSFPMPGGNILFAEGSFFHQRQICVSYTCEKGGWPGPRPQCARDRLPRTWQRLTHGQGLCAVLYGDSISWGGNASKMANTEPFQPSYGELFTEALARRWGAPIHFVNSAIGGKESNWGIEWVEPMVCDYAPDLVILAFGMNDGGKSPEAFAANLRVMIEKIRARRPQAEFLLVATSTPNPQLTDERAPFWSTQWQFAPAMQALAQEPALGGGIAVADITAMQRALHSRKRFLDTTGNHVNHPNDFFHRCYAQYLFGMLNDDGASPV